MAASPIITAGRAAPAIPLWLPADHIEPWRLFAFLSMVFGMIMAILDIAPGPLVGKAYKHMLEVRLDEGPLEHDDAKRRLLDWWDANRP